MSKDSLVADRTFCTACTRRCITATISQPSGLREDIIGPLRDDIVGTLREDIKKLDEKLSRKIDDLSFSVAEALDNHNEAMQPQLDDHDQRITKLETQTA